MSNKPAFSNFVIGINDDNTMRIEVDGNQIIIRRDERIGKIFVGIYAIGDDYEIYDTDAEAADRCNITIGQRVKEDE